MRNTRQQILNKAKELFFKWGFNKVTMDELALELGMSKKTIYNHFEGKSEILKQVVYDLKTELTAGVDRILINEDLNFVEKLTSILFFIGDKLSGVEAQFITDLRKSHPELSKELDNYKKEAAFNRFSSLLDEGIRNGCVREDIDKGIVVVLYASIIDWVVSPENIDQVPDSLKNQLPHKITDIFNGMVGIMLKGILKEH